MSSEYQNLNDAPEIRLAPSPKEAADYAAAIRLALNPPPAVAPQPIDEAAVALLLKEGKVTQETVDKFRAEHLRQELAHSAWMVNRNGRNALNNDPVTGAPGSELKSLLADSLAALRKEGYLS